MSGRQKDDDLEWMPLYIRKYERDTEHLTLEQDGAYMRLIRRMWATGSLIDDDMKLAAICGVTKTYWLRHLAPALKPFFTPDGNGRITQKRLQKEREKAREISEKRSVAGRQKGKLFDPKPLIGKGCGSANADQKQEQEPDQELTQVQRQEQESVQPLQEEAVAAREAPPPGPMPRLSDPPGKWMHLTGHKGERPTDDMALHPVVNGWYLTRAAKDVCEAAEITDPDYRGDWQVLIEWLEGFHLRNQIIPAIRYFVAKYGGGASSLRRFDKCVVEQWQRKDRAA